MYALQETGSAGHAVPTPEPVRPPPGQLEQRAVESSEGGGLETDERYAALYDSTSAILQLVESSARSFTEMLASADVAAEEGASEGHTSDDVGSEVDLYV